MKCSAVKEDFEQLITQHHREIYLYISRLTRGSSETEDLFQDTFLRAYKAYTRLPHEANTRAWLFRIATNLCRNYFRHLQRHPDVPLQDVLPTVERLGHKTNGTVPDDPEHILLAQDMQRHVLTLIAGLPLKQKAALIQRQLHGLSYDSIAASLQCSPEAARAHVFQALKKMRVGLENPPHAGRPYPRTAHEHIVRDTV